MYQNRCKVQGHNQKLMIKRAMDRGISPLPILTQGPNHTHYGVSLLANDLSMKFDLCS